MIDKDLTVEIKDDELIISIGTATLAFAAQMNEHSWPADFLINDVHEFSKDVLRELNREDETGTTPIHRLLDKAALEALDQGSMAAEEGDVEDGIALAAGYFSVKLCHNCES